MGSNELVEMSGCDVIEIDVAKMFWKSFSLSPPIESELFSPDITQRRRTAPPAGRNSSRKSRGDTSRSSNSRGLQIIDLERFNKDFIEEDRRRQTVYQTRIQTLMLLDKHRRRRLEKEAISQSVKPAKETREVNICPKKPRNTQEDQSSEVEEVKKLSLFRSKTIV